MASVETSKETVPDPPSSLGRRLKMVPGAFYISKERPGSKPQGEDAHFICAEKQAIGVADGVGGCARAGVDPGDYARQLMANSFAAIRMEPEGSADLRRVLNRAFSKTKAKGSSTACIVTLVDHGLHVANVGDSGFMLIRKQGDIYKSTIQQHYFNCPFQLGRTADTPKSAELFSVDVEAGDILIVGTDGLFDNMSEKRIRDVAKEAADQGLDPEQVAWALAEQAYHISLSRNAYTPYMIASINSGREFYGGKVDDITVIVAYIVDA